jgi:hypothetical protein
MINENYNEICGDNEHEGDDYCIPSGAMCTSPITTVYVSIDGDGDCKESHTPCNTITKAYNLLHFKYRRVVIIGGDLSFPGSIYPSEFSFNTNDENLEADIIIIGSSPLENEYVCSSSHTSSTIIPITTTSDHTSISFISISVDIYCSDITIFECNKGKIILDDVLLFLEESPSNPDIPLISSGESSNLTLISVRFIYCNDMISPVVKCSSSLSFTAKYIKTPLNLNSGNIFVLENTRNAEISFLYNNYSVNNNFIGILLYIREVESFVLSDSQYGYI